MNAFMHAAFMENIMNAALKSIFIFKIISRRYLSMPLNHLLKVLINCIPI